MSVIVEAAPMYRADTRPAGLRVDVVDNVAAAMPTWDALAATGAASAYQCPRFLSAWITHVAPTLGVSPRLGLVHDVRGKPVALLPFGISRRGPLRAIVYLGGRDSNLNMPLVDPSVSFTPDEAQDLLRRFARSVSPQPHLFILANQPRMWRGMRNPFALLRATPSPSAAFGATFGASAETFLAARESRDARKKLRSKAARLATLGEVSFDRATPAQANEAIAALVAQKQSHLAKRGIDSGLDTAAMRAFFASLATPADGPPSLEFHVLRVGARIAAVFGGLPHGDHWHGLINSFDDEPSIARCSPGDLLLRNLLADIAARGFGSFDLGIGEARYKAALCNETIELVDTIIATSLPGHAYAQVEALRLSAKRWMKQRPAVMKAARTIRSRLPHRQA